MRGSVRGAQILMRGELEEHSPPVSQVAMPDTAELGITVTDNYQRRGIARILMRELARYARTPGFRRLIGIVLPENRLMIALAESLGYSSNYDATDHLVHISLSL